MRSVPTSLAPSTIFTTGATKIEVRIPAALNSVIISFKKVLCFSVSQPAFEVMASSASGTKVT